MPEVFFPEFPLARFFFGGCVERGEGSNIRRSGHAHNHKDDPYRGWVCIKGKKPSILRLHDGKPTRLIIHEYAHILCPGQGHNERFYKTVYAMGGYETYFHGRGRFTKEMFVRANWDEVKDKLAAGWIPFATKGPLVRSEMEVPNGR